MIKAYKADIDLGLTSNGFLLKDFAEALWDAGLERINISLDTLDAKKAKILAQKDVLPSVLAGIEEAERLGFKIKLNTVALKGLNEDELVALLDFARRKNIQIRFIEFMENTRVHRALRGLKRDEILQILAQKYPITPIQKATKSPASLYDAGGYEFGIIDPHSDAFCTTCNRLRLSAEGLLIPCLYHDEALSIKGAMQKRNLSKALEILMRVLQNKPEKTRGGRWATKFLAAPFTRREAKFSLRIF